MQKYLPCNINNSGIHDNQIQEIRLGGTLK